MAPLPDGHGLLASVAVMAVSLSETAHVEKVTCRLLLAGDVVDCLHALLEADPAQLRSADLCVRRLESVTGRLASDSLGSCSPLPVPKSLRRG